MASEPEHREIDRLAEAHAALLMAASALAALSPEERACLGEGVPPAATQEEDNIIDNLIAWAFNDSVIHY